MSVAMQERDPQGRPLPRPLRGRPCARGPAAADRGGAADAEEAAGGGGQGHGAGG